MRGWIPAWRSLFEREDWLAPTTRNPACYGYAWLDLCQRAQHEPYDHAGMRLDRGEVLVSVRAFADRWGWSKSSVSRFLNRLESGTMIGTVRGTPRGTVYRIVNYETYAVSGEREWDTQGDEERDTSGTRAGQEQQLSIDHIQEETQPNGRRKYPQPFEELWKVGRRRGPKSDALREYEKAVPKLISHDALLEALKTYVASVSEDKYITHLHRWIKRRSWEGQEKPEPRLRSFEEKYGEPLWG